MASSRVMMTSRSPSNPDPPRHHVGSMNVEDFLTLEDYLTKAGAMSVDDDVTVPLDDVAIGYNNNNDDNINQFGSDDKKNVIGFGGNGHVAVGGGRGKRRAAAVVEETVMDKATQQKQRRMIKNRESAARSRERKQAYTVELESLVTHLEEENARLLRQEEELNKARYKQLMENLIPVTEKKRPPRVLRRVRSMEW